jgi:serine/threonine protein phosphatase PrpC
MTLDQVVTQRDVQGQPISRLAYAVGAGLRDLPPELVEDLTEKCFAGDVYVLVTDGVTGAAGSDEALTAALEAPDASGLLDLALAQGGPDNATAVRLELLP